MKLYYELNDKEFSEDLFMDYLKWGGFPLRFDYDDEASVHKYLSNLYESIVNRDIVGRTKSADKKAFMDISLYILANAGKEVKKTISSKICDMNSVEELDIPNINIICEENGYRIKWFETGKGRVKRRGGNEDFGIKGRQLAGVPNVLNETAFILGENQLYGSDYDFAHSG